MSKPSPDTPKKSWSSGLENPAAAWRMKSLDAPGERGAAVAVIGGLVDALSSLTGRWLRYDGRRKPNTTPPADR